jgi:integrase
MTKRYKKLQHTSIRKDELTNTYNVRKKIEGKLHSRSFPSIVECKRWLNEFHPDLHESDFDSSPTFKDMYADYDKEITSTLEYSSREVKRQRARLFLKNFSNVRINKLDFDFFKQFFKEQKLEALKDKSRYSFDKEIKELKAIFNWYREYRDYTFIVPLTKVHKQIGKVRKKVPKNKKMTLAQVNEFFNAFESDLYRDIATAQFFCCARISEIAGVQLHSINLDDSIITIKDVVVWSRGKKFIELKPYPKNNDIKFIRIAPPLLAAIKRRLNETVIGSNYLFHINGEPVSYRSIQHNYDQAFKKANLDQFSGTHTLRHSMASIARQLTGSIDAVQALTGHKSTRQAEHYAGITYHSQVLALDSVSKELEILEAKMFASGSKVVQSFSEKVK